MSKQIGSVLVLNVSDSKEKKYNKLRNVLKKWRRKIYMTIKEMEIKMTKNKVNSLWSYSQNIIKKLKKYILDFELLLEILYIILKDNIIQFRKWKNKKEPNIYFNNITVKKSLIDKFKILQFDKEYFNYMTIEDFNLNFYYEEWFLFTFKFHNLTINYSNFIKNYKKSYLVSKKLILLIHKFKFTYSFKINYEIIKSIMTINKFYISLNLLNKIYDLLKLFLNIIQFILFKLRDGTPKIKKKYNNTIKLILIFLFQLFFYYYKNKNIYKIYEYINECNHIVTTLDENDFHLFVISINDMVEDYYYVEDELIEYEDIITNNNFFKDIKLYGISDINKPVKKNRKVKKNKNQNLKINVKKNFSNRNYKSAKFFTHTTQNTIETNNYKKKKKVLKTIESNIYDNSPKWMTSKMYFLKKNYFENELKNSKRDFHENLNNKSKFINHSMKYLTNKSLKNKNNNPLKEDIYYFKTIIENSLNRDNKINNIDKIYNDSLYQKRLEDIDNIEFKNVKKLLLIKKANKKTSSDLYKNMDEVKKDLIFKEQLTDTKLILNKDKNSEVKIIGRKKHKNKWNLKKIILRNNQIFNWADSIYKKQKNLVKDSVLRNKIFKKYVFNKEEENKKLKLIFENEIVKFEKIITNKKDLNLNYLPKSKERFIKTNRELCYSITNKRK